MGFHFGLGLVILGQSLDKVRSKNRMGVRVRPRWGKVGPGGGRGGLGSTHPKKISSTDLDGKLSRQNNNNFSTS